MNFEDSLKKIEEILAQLEGGNLPLEDAMLLYQQGTALSNECKTQLAEAKLKVTQLNAGGSDDTGK